MKEKIQICQRNENGSLTVVIEDKKLLVELDENTMTPHTINGVMRFLAHFIFNIL